MKKTDIYELLFWLVATVGSLRYKVPDVTHKSYIHHCFYIARGVQDPITKYIPVIFLNFLNFNSALHFVLFLAQVIRWGLRAPIVTGVGIVGR